MCARSLARTGQITTSRRRLPISQKQKPSWEKRGSSTALPPSPPRGNKGAWEPKNHEGAGRAPGLLLLCYIGILGSDTEILYIMQKKALRAYVYFFSSSSPPPSFFLLLLLQQTARPGEEEKECCRLCLLLLLSCCDDDGGGLY